MLKKIICIITSIVVTASLCINMQPVSFAAEAAQKAMYLFPSCLDVIGTVDTHKYMSKYPNRKPFDIVNPDSPKSDAYAPFDCKIVKIDNTQGNAVFIESLSPVLFADGTEDYMTILLAHDNDISDLYEGMTISQGTIFFQQGDIGEAYGNHIHIEAARGAFSTSGSTNIWPFVRSHAICLNDALFLYPNTAIINTGKYSWRTSDSSTSVPAETEHQNSIAINTSEASSISTNDAYLSGSFNASQRTSVSEAGVYLGTSQDNLSKVAYDSVNYSNTFFKMWYTLSKYGVTLTPGTTYYYKCYVVSNGNTVFGNVSSFTTSGSAPVADGGSTPVSSNVAIADGTYTLSPQCAPGKCIDVAGGEMDDSVNVQIYEANGTDAQKIQISNIGNGYYKLIFVHSGKSLDVEGGSGDSGINVQQYSWNDTTAQHWAIQNAGDGYYYLINQTGGKYLDVGGGGSDNGTNVQVYDGNQTTAQKWALVNVSNSYTAYVSGTDGALAINSTPAAGNQIGRIPEGANCTVYPDKANGNWYWVEYNGISGYAYGKYLTTSQPSAPSVSTENTYQGRISGTDGALAINSQPHSGCQIGRIPEGEYCTVYPDKASGNWYWVEYNGVSGYAYGKYIVR